MTRTAMLLGAACWAASAGLALADGQDNTVANPSFENADPFFPGDPEGWATFNVGSPGWNDDFARTGSMSIALSTSTGGQPFTGWTTNVFDINGDLYDPPFEYLGGDLYVSGWYLIPNGQELAPGGVGAPLDLVTIKLEFRRVPPNFSIYQGFELPPIGVSTTNGTWVQYEHVFDQDQISPDFPPFPGSVTILPFRFRTGDTWQGTIYWDDLCVYQLTDTCFCDADASGSLNIDDIDLFATAFLGGSLDADCDGSGSLNIDDIDCFAACFLGGCP